MNCAECKNYFFVFEEKYCTVYSMDREREPQGNAEFELLLWCVIVDWTSKKVIVVFVYTLEDNGYVAIDE